MLIKSLDENAYSGNKEFNAAYSIGSVFEVVQTQNEKSSRVCLRVKHGLFGLFPDELNHFREIK